MISRDRSFARNAFIYFGCKFFERKIIRDEVNKRRLKFYFKIV